VGSEIQGMRRLLYQARRHLLSCLCRLENAWFSCFRICSHSSMTDGCGEPHRSISYADFLKSQTITVFDMSKVYGLYLWKYLYKRTIHTRWMLGHLSFPLHFVCKPEQYRARYGFRIFFGLNFWECLHK
jgi:hypothetical protein